MNNEIQRLAMSYMSATMHTYPNMETSSDSSQSINTNQNSSPNDLLWGGDDLEPDFSEQDPNPDLGLAQQRPFDQEYSGNF